MVQLKYICVCFIIQVDNDDRYCYDDDICTARCNCWDGERVRTEDTESFDLNDVEDQGTCVSITFTYRYHCHNSIIFSHRYSVP